MTAVRLRARSRAAILVVALAVLPMAGCTSGAPSRDAGATEQDQDLPDLTDCPDPTGQPAEGEQTLPALTLPCLDGAGGELTLGEAPGAPTVVNLWATWCRPCIAELPLFEELHLAADPAALRIVGVNSRDSASFAADLVEELGLSFANGFDDNGDVMVAAGVRNLPETIFLDANGGLTFVKRDKVIETYAELVALVREHLGVSL